MADEKVVKYIVRTYDLVPKVEDRIIKKAMRRIDELFITSFDDQYEYIARLIDYLGIPYGARIVSLDSIVKSGSESTFYDILGREDMTLKDLLEPEELQERLSAHDIISILKGYMDKSDLNLMRRLLYYKGNSKDLQLNISRKWLLASIPKIKERLEVLANNYRKDGQLFVPQRPIIDVSFFPSFSIKFGRREYNGDPLAFYRNNLEVYGGMGRRQLSKFDSGLYCALRRANQLHHAIPKADRSLVERGMKLGKRVIKLSHVQIEEIIDSHKTYNGNMLEASRCTPYSIDSIRKYWKLAGLNPLKRGRPKKRVIRFSP